MHITVISPDRAVLDGDAVAITAPAYDGLIGILPRHAPFVTLLGDGRLTVRTVDATLTFRVRGGVLQVVRDSVRVVTEHADVLSDRKGD
jgi:F-type H+-transporting ATPase subunit epsilon